MSNAEPAPESMSRAELEQEVSELRRDVRDVNARMDALNTRFDAVFDLAIGDRELGESVVEDSTDLFTRIEDLEGAVTSHGDTLASIADVGEDATTEEEKVSSIVAYAEQARNANADKVLVTPKEVQGATGVSQRYAYDLVDKIGGNDDGGGFADGRFPWAAVREATSVPSSDGTERKPKALKIDFGRVQRSEGSLNWFNNGSGGEGDR